METIKLVTDVVDTIQQLAAVVLLWPSVDALQRYAKGKKLDKLMEDQPPAWKNELGDLSDALKQAWTARNHSITVVASLILLLTAGLKCVMVWVPYW